MHLVTCRLQTMPFSTTNASGYDSPTRRAVDTLLQLAETKSDISVLQLSTVHPGGVRHVKTNVKRGSKRRTAGVRE